MSKSEEETYSTIFTALKHPIRRKILRMLSRRARSFSEMQEVFKIESSHLTYHLESLGDLLFKTKDGKYALSSFGQAATSMMYQVEETPKAPPMLPSLSLKWKACFAVLMVGLILSAGLYYVQYQALSQLSADYESTKTEAEQLRNDYDATKAEFEQLGDDYERIETNFERLKDEYNRTKAELEQLQNQYNTLKTDAERLQSDYNETKEELMQLQNEYAKIEAEAERLQNLLEQYLGSRIIFVDGSNVGDLLEDGSFAHPFDMIQEGVNAAIPRDLVLVASGTYYEHVTIAKSLTLIGEDRSNTIIDGNEIGTVIHITADNVSINGFTVQNSARYLYGGGIILHNSSNCYIHENKVSNNIYGILLELCCTNCSVYDNIVTYNGHGIGVIYSWNCSVYSNTVIRGGIWLSDSSHCYVYGNTGTDNPSFILVDSSSNLYIHDNNAKGNSKGISLIDSSNCTLRKNNMKNNNYNLGVHGESLQTFIHDIDASNTINGKRVFYLINQRKLAINSSTYLDIGYLAVVNSTLITVEELTLTSNEQGALIAYVTNSAIKNVTATNNYYGIQLSHSSNFSVFDNTLATNKRDGIRLDHCFNDSLYANTLTNNINGIKLWYSSNISVYDNKAIDNGGSCINCGGIRLSHSFNCFVYNNDLIRNNDGISLEKSSNSHIYGNNIISNKYHGIEAWRGLNNTIFHNNFVENRRQVHFFPPLANFWDNGSEGNYWSDYGELDIDGDGIGEMPYVIDVDNQDRYPLVVPLGPIPIVWDGTIYPVELKSNSTISRFQFKALQKMISFNVTGPDGTLGFCNISILNSLIQDLWQGNYTVLVDGKQPLTIYDWTNSKYTYVCFTYLHSEHKIEIIPEFPSALILPLLMIIALVAVVLRKTT